MNKIVPKRIGFLVTGSEIISGEVLNSNSAKMADILQEWGISLGEHILCDDGAMNIEAALQFLLTRHDAIIVSGGLGPTSDDVTRLAIANVANQKLCFYEPSWKKIEERLKKRNLPIPENNRQQAFFPEEARVLMNENGTADGCVLEIDHTPVFMLPGPPRECLPMFKEQVFPVLKEQGFTSPLRLFRWRLLGVSESAIAELLDPIAQEFETSFAYRAGYPFVDIKLMLNPHNKNHSKILLQVEQAVKPYFATHLNELLTKQLHDLIIDTHRTLFIEQDVTQGHFSQRLNLPKENIATFKADADISVAITGLKHYWNENYDNEVFDSCKANISVGNKTETFEHKQILLRGKETLNFVSEFTALKVLAML